ncbi:hypothetical protein ACS79_20295 [Vibrio lentus]|uniref:Uncharacterized protein n=2 Tax=Vibrionaceae TaxID=641 RepID=A0A2T5DW23_VIBSP|nr:hypothetical protein ACS79_20295 [Vibrio lentus]OEE71556.1 hypothetical protein A147_13420 [Vibrio splendidus FF-6]PTP10698.1 hypothetical protein CWO36_25710 [Vibrio splendidus]
MLIASPFKLLHGGKYMSVYKEKNLDELSSQELNDYQNLVNRTIAQLSIELKSSSPSRAKDAQDRLIHWEERLSNLVSFLNNRK